MCKDILNGNKRTSYVHTGTIAHDKTARMRTKHVGATRDVAASLLWIIIWLEQIYCGTKGSDPYYSILYLYKMLLYLAILSTASYNMISPVFSKSVFEIRPYAKKSVTVGLLVNKKILNLDFEQWLTLMCENNYNTFDTAYSLIMADVNGLPFSCRRNEFTNQYSQNYDLSYMADGPSSPKYN
ncbi:hypothetical protein AGLY_016645 [Aphis glycines]|uniref:Uncharacterized protein n=1 Tax=Aphis glycines TaxID=307491 RepID=A0A6G0SYH9_APHGL|nr:hypothetical protein AGLY_016645 [Aphis glycines]